MKREKRRLIAVASGFQTKNTRSNGSLRLLNWGLEILPFRYQKMNIFKVSSWLGKSTEIDGITKEDVFVTMMKKEARNLKANLKYKAQLKHQLLKIKKLLTLVYIKDNLIKNVPVYASKKVDKVIVFKSLFMSLNYLIWGDV